MLREIAHALGISEPEFKSIADGEASQAFRFKVANKSKILRISTHSDTGFKKDRFASEHFNSTDVPIPKVEEIGLLKNGMHYAISELVEGKTLDKLSATELKTTLPSIVRTLTAIHETPPVGSGFGLIGLEGKGNRNSWHEALDSSLASNDDDVLDSIPMFERKLSNKFKAIIMDSYKYCPNNLRRLIHRDFGYNNALAKDGKITGVIDWDDAAYGDPLYDVAWQSFWAPAYRNTSRIDIVAIFKQHYIELNQMPEHFEARINCYKMIIGVNSMSFYAKSNQRQSYAFVRDQLLSIPSQEQ